MSIAINGDLQVASGDLLDQRGKPTTQWPDVHANPGCAVVLRSDDPDVPPGCPWPLVGRFEAQPYAALDNRPRADIGQRLHDARQGVTRYYVWWSYFPDAFLDLVSEPGAQVIVADWHAVLGTNPLRITDGLTLEMQVLAGQRMPYVPGRTPKGWWPYSGWTFETRRVVPLVDLEQLRGRWFSHCCQWTWSTRADRGRFAYHLDGRTRLRWYGQTLSSTDGITPDERYAKLGVYELPGAVVWHTGWRSVTRWREAVELMTAPTWA